MATGNRSCGRYFPRTRGFRAKFGSIPSSRPSFNPRTGFNAFPRPQANDGLAFKTPGQPKFCSVCRVVLNSDFQSREHFTGKGHLAKVKFLSNVDPQLIASGSNQIVSYSAKSVGGYHQPFKGQSKPVKRKMINYESNFEPKKSKLLQETASQYKTNLPFLSKELHCKTPLALLYEFRNGLVISVSNRLKASDDELLSYTASLEWDGKAYSASGPTKRKAQQQLAEIIISEFQPQFEEMLEKRAAAKLPNNNANKFQSKLPFQKVQQISLPFGARVRDKSDNDFTSNDNLCNSSTFSTFDSATDFLSSGTAFDGSTSVETVETVLEPVVGQVGRSQMELYPSIVEPEFNGTVALTYSSAELKYEFDGGTDDTSSALTILENNQRSVSKRTAVAVLNVLRPGLKWTVTTENLGDATGGSSSEVFVISMFVDGEIFTGSSSVKLLARQYAAEAVLASLFGLEFEHDNDGMPLFKGNIDGISGLKETLKKDQQTGPLDVDGKNPICILNELFINDVLFDYRSPVVSEFGLEHCCSISVAGITVEGRDSLKKNAKKRAALAAVAALKASGMYDRKVAEVEARRAGLPVEQVMIQQHARSSLAGAKFTRTASALPESAEMRLSDLYPKAAYVLQSQTLDLKGRNYVVSVQIGDQTFLGRGRQMDLARADAAENALRTFGLWTSDDEKTKTRLSTPFEAGKRKPAFSAVSNSFHPNVLHKKSPYRGRGRGSAVRGNRGYKSVTGVNYYNGNGNFNVSTLTHPGNPAGFKKPGANERPVPRGMWPRRVRRAGAARANKNRTITPTVGASFETGNGGFGHSNRRGRAEPVGGSSRIRFVGLNKTGASQGDYVNSQYENQYDYTLNSPSFGYSDLHDAHVYGSMNDPHDCMSMPEAEYVEVDGVDFGGSEWGKGYGFNTTITQKSTSVSYSHFQKVGTVQRQSKVVYRGTPGSCVKRSHTMTISDPNFECTSSHAVDYDAIPEYLYNDAYYEEDANLKVEQFDSFCDPYQTFCYDENS